MQSALLVQGLEKGIDYKKVLKAFKKDFCCNGTVVEDTELGQVGCHLLLLEMFLTLMMTCVTLLSVSGHTAAG